jgi:hypothetical protein
LLVSLSDSGVWKGSGLPHDPSPTVFLPVGKNTGKNTSKKEEENTTDDVSKVDKSANFETQQRDAQGDAADLEEECAALLAPAHRVAQDFPVV